MSMMLDELGRRATASVATPAPTFDQLAIRAATIERAERRRRRAARISVGIVPTAIVAAAAIIGGRSALQTETGETPADAPASASGFEAACRDDLEQLRDDVDRHMVAPPSLVGDDAQAKVFEPRFVNEGRFANEGRVVVLYDERRFYWCEMLSSQDTIVESGGGIAAATAPLADDQVQVIVENWRSATEPDGSCGDRPCGPGTVLVFGRVGASVASVQVVLLDDSITAARIEPDHWFIGYAQAPPGVWLQVKQISWTLDDNTKHSVDIADLQEAAGPQN